MKLFKLDLDFKSLAQHPLSKIAELEITNLFINSGSNILIGGIDKLTENIKDEESKKIVKNAFSKSVPEVIKKAHEEVKKFLENNFKLIHEFISNKIQEILKIIRDNSQSLGESIGIGVNILDHIINNLAGPMQSFAEFVENKVVILKIWKKRFEGWFVI